MGRKATRKNFRILHSDAVMNLQAEILAMVLDAPGKGGLTEAEINKLNNSGYLLRKWRRRLSIVGLR